VLAVALVAAPTLARVQRHEVTVVKRGAVRLRAWDSASVKKGICFRLWDGSQKNAFCDRSGKHKLRLAYTSVVNKTGSATAVGGDARRGETKVVATFADGQKLTLRTVRSKRYRGRQGGKARFWAGQLADATKLVSLQAKNSHGSAVETITVPNPTPGPGPGPVPSPPPPCHCGPPVATPSQIICPLRPCPA
jgi:hypothetical protein